MNGFLIVIEPHAELRRALSVLVKVCAPRLHDVGLRVGAVSDRGGLDNFSSRTDKLLESCGRQGIIVSRLALLDVRLVSMAVLHSAPVADSNAPGDRLASS